ncbi:ABC-type sugar transport system substrate-binding protein [Bradyrhizobium diazoefficiens]|uniref:ABC transporter sugar-binding protein n=1 Tax=Bradyrhizobium diazoefficiens TaxID=1355477 RepID=A0A0E4BUP6_9BRAD|nr:ABC transporter sugar-binding protein [Bradyrhizobium diazoefficiens]
MPPSSPSASRRSDWNPAGARLRPRSPSRRPRKVNLKIADAQQKQENQIKAIRSFIAQNVDAIFLAPVVSTGWDSVLKEAKEAKIPVVLLDRDIDPSGKELYLTAVTSDSVHEGEVAGDWLAKTVGGKACNIVELQGTVGASVAANRKKGFDTAIAKHANLKVVRSQTGDFTRAKGKEVMESFIKAEGGGKSICAVYAHNDDMMVGAIQAMKEAGLKPGKEILTVSIDAVPDIFKAMAAGEANATVELTPNMAGPALDAIAAFKDKGTVPPKWIQTESRLYTAADDPQLRQQEGPRLLRRAPCRTAHLWSGTPFGTAAQTNRLGVRSISGRRWE